MSTRLALSEWYLLLQQIITAHSRMANSSHLCEVSTQTSRYPTFEGAGDSKLDSPLVEVDDPSEG